jgi:uncharacterized lipoprotein YajG
MSKPQIMMPILVLAGLCLLAGCSGKSAPAASTAAPAAPSGNASQGGGVKLDDPGRATNPDGGGIKNP